MTYLHVFPYSGRPGTDASYLPVKVPGACMRERARAIRTVGAELAERFRASQVGAVRSDLTMAGGTLAVTDNYLKVRLPPGHGDNQRVNVRITAAGETLTGEVVHQFGAPDGLQARALPTLPITLTRT